MKVKELIEELNKFDSEWEVVYEFDSCHWNISGLSTDEDYIDTVIII